MQGNTPARTTTALMVSIVLYMPPLNIQKNSIVGLQRMPLVLAEPPASASAEEARACAECGVQGCGAAKADAAAECAPPKMTSKKKKK